MIALHNWTQNQSNVPVTLCYLFTLSAMLLPPYSEALLFTFILVQSIKCVTTSRETAPANTYSMCVFKLSLTPCTVTHPEQWRPHNTEEATQRSISASAAKYYISAIYEFTITASTYHLPSMSVHAGCACVAVSQPI